MRLFQKGFNYSQDGPGNRLVYHLQGCNLRCPWCSNPEGLAMTGGTEYAVADLAEEARRSRMLFFDGGGITLTGGEVTVQLEQAKELLSSVHREGIHTCIETNGISPRLPELYPYLDLLICDVKHYDAEKHKSVTGLSNESVGENLELAVQMGTEVAVRIPFIGGFNAELTDVTGFAAWFEKKHLLSVITVELLPYHEYGKTKYEGLGIPYTMGQEAKVTKSRVEAFEKGLRENGIRVIHT